MTNFTTMYSLVLQQVGSTIVVKMLDVLSRMGNSVLSNMDNLTMCDHYFVQIKVCVYVNHYVKCFGKSLSSLYVIGGEVTLYHVGRFIITTNCTVVCRSSV